MPKHIEGSPDKQTLSDPRYQISADQEKRLLELALQKGIGDEQIGTFYVVLVSDMPAEANEKGYMLFSEDELLVEAEKHNGWFYDTDNRRLIGTIPTTRDILARMKS